MIYHNRLQENVHPTTFFITHLSIVIFKAKVNLIHEYKVEIKNGIKNVTKKKIL